nr:immunoglobulin light chain junction region [Macaca mulatta]MOW63467.1 immunoglobulin light chain junction region [Macaca mulatta]MOW64961.1 immunoglobulin light chain junction region [Macaca mulatta]
CQHSYGTPWTF